MKLFIALSVIASFSTFSQDFTKVTDKPGSTVSEINSIEMEASAATFISANAINEKIKKNEVVIYRKKNIRGNIIIGKDDKLSTANVMQQISLQECNIQGSIIIKNATFLTRLSLWGTTVRGSITIERSRFIGSFAAYGATILGGIKIKWSRFLDDVTLSTATISGESDFYLSNFLGQTSLGATFKGPVYFNTLKFSNMSTGSMPLAGATFLDEVEKKSLQNLRTRLIE